MRKVFIYPKQFNFEQYFKNVILNMSEYKWGKYKLFHIIKKLYYTQLFDSYILYKKYYFLNKEHKIEEYDMQSLNVSEIFNILVGLFGMNTQMEIKKYFTMVGNSQNLFTMYNYCILEYKNAEIIESTFPTFQLEYNTPQLILTEVKNDSSNVQSISTRKIEDIDNKNSKINIK